MIRLKRLLSVFLALILTLSVFAFTPSQTEAASVKKGSMLLVGTAAGPNAIKLTWKKAPGAKRYVISTAPCGNMNYKKLKTLKKNKTSYVVTGLKTGTSYKYVISAQKKVNGKYKTIAKSVIVHVMTDGNTHITNPKSVALNKTKLTLGEGKSKKIKATVKKSDGSKDLLDRSHADKIRFVSSATKVARVSKSGKITAVGAGKCKVYAIAINGVSAACKVTVKAAAKPAAPKEVKSHTVTYSYTGTVPEGAPKVPAKATYKTGASVTKAAVPTLEGYEFSGWSGEVTTMPDKDVQVTGSWSKKKITITYYCPNPEYYENYDGEDDEYSDVSVDDLINGDVTLNDITSAETIDYLIDQCEKWISNGESYKEDHPDDWTEEDELDLKNLKDLLPKLEARLEKLDENDSDNSGKYLIHKQTLEYGDTSDKLLLFADIKSFADAYSDWYFRKGSPFWSLKKRPIAYYGFVDGDEIKKADIIMPGNTEDPESITKLTKDLKLYAAAQLYLPS